MIRKFLIGICVLTLAACGGGGGGSSMPQVDPGPPPPGGSVPPPAPVQPVSPTPDFATAEELIATITSVTIDSPPVAEFQVTDGNGFAILDLTAANVRFAIAKLVPGAAGSSSAWASYINNSVGQATTESGGGLVNHGDGTYTYTFLTDVTNAAVDYEPDLTHRVAIQFSGGVPVNPYYDWLPATGATTGIETRNVVTVQSCNSCHDQLAFHGGGRIETEYCVTCHNPGTIDPDTGNTVDFKVMIHKIHRGKDLPSVQAGEPYQFIGYRNTVYDYSNVNYPGDMRSCTTCHAGTATDPGEGSVVLTSEGDNWREVPTIAACGSCHDDVDFTTHMGGQEDDSNCLSCHGQGKFKDLQVAHLDQARGFAKERGLSYVIDAAELIGDELTVSWRAVSDGANIVHGADGWQLSTTLRVGWFDTDFTHSNPQSTRPGAPVEVNAVQGATEAGGVYTQTVDLTGTGVEGNLLVTLGGNVSSADYSALVASNAIHYVGTERRQVVSNATCTNCHEERFGAFNKHGGNRHNDVRQCLLCHNNNSTDIDRRTHNPRPYIASPFPDGKAEQATNLMVMVHGLHGAAAGFRNDDLWITGFGSWSQWDGDSSFPGRLSNCSMCHEGNSYYPLSLGLAPRGTTTNTLNDAGFQPHEVDGHWKTTAALAACGSCHDTQDARAHMSQNGGEINWDQPTIDASSGESCATCHGPDRLADVKQVHNVTP